MIYGVIKKEVSKTPSQKTLDSNISTESNKNFEPGFIWCSDFFSWKFKRISAYIINASFAYFNLPFYELKQANKMQENKSIPRVQS